MSQSIYGRSLQQKRLGRNPVVRTKSLKRNVQIEQKEVIESLSLAQDGNLEKETKATLIFFTSLGFLGYFCYLFNKFIHVELSSNLVELFNRSIGIFILAYLSGLVLANANAFLIEFISKKVHFSLKSFRNEKYTIDALSWLVAIIITYFVIKFMPAMVKMVAMFGGAH